MPLPGFMPLPFEGIVIPPGSFPIVSSVTYTVDDVR